MSSSVWQKVRCSLLRLVIKDSAAVVSVFLFLSLFLLPLALRKPAVRFVQPYDPFNGERSRYSEQLKPHM